jgi:16S rRNA processing protein RimM
VTVGRVSGLFGVRGWVKVFSHTEPRDNILEYQPWLLEIAGETRAYRVVDGRAHGKGIVAQLEGVETRDDAAVLIGSDIAVERAQFAPLRAGEYYHADLEGLDVVTADGVPLGRVSHLFDTGANAVMVLKGERERLVPFTPQAVLDVDMDARRITVDWDPEF